MKTRRFLLSICVWLGAASATAAAAACGTGERSESDQFEIYAAVVESFADAFYGEAALPSFWLDPARIDRRGRVVGSDSIAESIVARLIDAGIVRGRCDYDRQRSACLGRDAGAVVRFSQPQGRRPGRVVVTGVGFTPTVRDDDGRLLLAPNFVRDRFVLEHDGNVWTVVEHHNEITT